MRPIQHAIYKGMSGKFGAIQFNLQPPHYYNGKQKSFNNLDSDGHSIFEDAGGLKEGWKEREGVIFMDIASTKDKNVYDWDNKITMALSLIDIGKVLFTLATGKESSIMHDPGAKSESQGAVKKYLSVSSPNGTSEGVFFRCSQQAAGQTKKHEVPISGDEVMVLRQLLQSAVSRSLGW
jgi:hypothetical protein